MDRSTYLSAGLNSRDLNEHQRFVVIQYDPYEQRHEFLTSARYSAIPPAYASQLRTAPRTRQGSNARRIEAQDSSEHTNPNRPTIPETIEEGDIEELIEHARETLREQGQIRAPEKEHNINTPTKWDDSEDEGRLEQRLQAARKRIKRLKKQQELNRLEQRIRQEEQQLNHLKPGVNLHPNSLKRTPRTQEAQVRSQAPAQPMINAIEEKAPPNPSNMPTFSVRNIQEYTAFMKQRYSTYSDDRRKVATTINHLDHATLNSCAEHTKQWQIDYTWEEFEDFSLRKINYPRNLQTEASYRYHRVIQKKKPIGTGICNIHGNIRAETSTHIPRLPQEGALVGKGS